MSRILAIISAFAMFSPATYMAYSHTCADSRMGRY
jgi:hypothetical protein